MPAAERFLEMRYVLLAALALAGCTADNPDYCGPSGWRDCKQAYIYVQPDLLGFQVVPLPDMTVVPATADLSEPKLPDVDGVFLLALSTAFAPGDPLVFRATASLDRLLDLDLQPLSVNDEDGNGKPDRKPVGERISLYRLTVDATGNFTADAGTHVIAGAANLTGAPLTVALRLTGRIANKDRMCGVGDGRVTEPFAVDLKGSTWGAVRMDPAVKGEATPPAPDPCE